MVSEQFLNQCDEKLAVFLKERGCKSLDLLAETADHYIEAQGLINLGRGREDKDSGKLAGLPRAPDRQDHKAKLYCLLCNKQGHRPSDCWAKSRDFTQPNRKSPFCVACRKHGHRAEACPEVPESEG